jgi:hypothetical protein
VLQAREVGSIVLPAHFCRTLAIYCGSKAKPCDTVFVALVAVVAEKRGVGLWLKKILNPESTN